MKETINSKEIPDSIEEAIETVLNQMKHQPMQMKDFGQDEKRFVVTTHNWLGMKIRNAWQLWYDTSKELPHLDKPSIVQEFNDLGITHADDMSGIILITAFRRYHKREEDIPGQVQWYKDFWAKERSY